MNRRRKISTTVSAESYAYLRSLVRTRQARNLARAVDLAVERLRRADSRTRLERDTSAYFQRLTGKARAEEERLEQALGESLDEVGFDA